MNDRSATFDEAVARIQAEVAALLRRKQADYGPVNLRLHGEFGVVVRLQDKVARLTHLLGPGRAARNEPVEDTWLDVIGYGICGLMLRRGWWGLPLEETLHRPADGAEAKREPSGETGLERRTAPGPHI